MWVLLAHEDDEPVRYGEQAATLCRGLGLPARAVSWQLVPGAAKEVAMRAPRSLLVIVGRADTLIVRGASALRAAFAEASAVGSGGGGRGIRGGTGSTGGARNQPHQRGVLVAAGLPSLGWMGDAALRAATRPHLWSSLGGEGAEEGTTQKAVGPRGLRHADGACLLGGAADVANLLARLAARVGEGDAPSLPAAIQSYWATWQHGEALLPRIVLDAGEAVACTTLAPDEDLVPVIDERRGTPAIRTAAALTRPCLVRAPYGGSLAAVLHALRMPVHSSCTDTSQAADPSPRAAAVAAALRQLWSTHQLEVALVGILLGAVLAWVLVTVGRWLLSPSKTQPHPGFMPPPTSFPFASASPPFAPTFGSAQQPVYYVVRAA